jgi:hypothetical protein
MFLGLTFLKFCLSDADLVEEEIEVVDGVCWDTEISDVARRIFISGQAGRRDCIVKNCSVVPCIHFYSSQTTYLMRMMMIWNATPEAK